MGEPDTSPPRVGIITSLVSSKADSWINTHTMMMSKSANNRIRIPTLGKVLLLNTVSDILYSVGGIKSAACIRFIKKIKTNMLDWSCDYLFVL